VKDAQNRKRPPHERNGRLSAALAAVRRASRRCSAPAGRSRHRLSRGPKRYPRRHRPRGKVKFRGTAKEFLIPGRPTGRASRRGLMGCLADQTSSSREAGNDPPVGAAILHGHSPGKRVPVLPAATSASCSTDFKCVHGPCTAKSTPYALQVTAARVARSAEGPRHLRLTGLSTKLPQLPRPALGRRAAARCDRARVRQTTPAACSPTRRPGTSTRDQHDIIAVFA